MTISEWWGVVVVVVVLVVVVLVLMVVKMPTSSDSIFLPFSLCAADTSA